MSATARPLPGALHAAALPAYAAEYGGSVAELDRELGATAAGEDLIDLTHGDVRAFEPPAAAAADLTAAVAENREAYTDYRGSAGVRELLAPRLAQLLGRPVDPAAQLIITPGTQGGLFAALSALIGPGDVVAVPDPDYFMSERIVAYLGARAIRLPVAPDADGHLRFAPGALEAAGEAGALLFSHPNNPTGGVYAPEEIETLAAWLAAGDRVAVADQLYCRQLFSGAQFVHLGALEGMAQRTVTLVGPSKTESMSGYRLGAAVGPGPVIDAIERVLAMASLRTTAYAQQALHHWMDDDGPWLAQRVAAHQALRDRLLDALRAIDGVAVGTPQGSSYVFVDTAATPWATARGGGPALRGNALAIALKQAGVLINPGYQFGHAVALSFRINFSQDQARLMRAVDRIGAVLGAP